MMNVNMKNDSQTYLFTIHLFDFIEHYNSKHYQPVSLENKIKYLTVIKFKIRNYSKSILSIYNRNKV